MKGKARAYALGCGILLLLLSACQGGGDYSPAAAAATAPEPSPAPGYTMGTGPGQPYGMMQQNGGRMSSQMGRGMMGDGMGGGMMGGEGYQGEPAPQQPSPPQQYRGRASGSDIFANNCSGCHPNGGNAFNANFPVRGAPELETYARFRALVRQGRGPMPAFSSSRIPEAQLRELYRYARSAFGD